MVRDPSRRAVRFFGMTCLVLLSQAQGFTVVRTVVRELHPAG
jgi:hypothetical protein